MVNKNDYYKNIDLLIQKWYMDKNSESQSSYPIQSMDGSNPCLTLV